MHYDIVADLALYNSALMLLERLDLPTRISSLPWEYQHLLDQLRSDLSVAAIGIAILPRETSTPASELARNAAQATMEAIDAIVRPLFAADAELSNAWQTLCTPIRMQQPTQQRGHTRSFQQMLGHWHESVV